MKKPLIVVLAAVLIFGVATYVQGAGSAKPKKGIIVGEVIEIVSYVMKGDHGPKFAEAGARRSDQGFPLGILEEDSGIVYLAAYKDPAPASHLQPAAKVLRDLVGTKIVAQGLIYKSKDTRVIRIGAVSEY